MAAWRSGQNPFVSTFGSQPPLMVGREQELERIRTGIGSGPTDPNFTILLIGQRGYGKTVILGKLEREAPENDWATIKVNCADDRAMADISRQAQTLLKGRYSSWVKKFTRGIKGGGVSVLGTGVHLDLDTSPNPPEALMPLLEAVGKASQADGAGVLVLVDEMHALSAQDRRTLAVVMQRVTRELEYPVAYLGAGLPSLAAELIADEAVSFFHRCPRLKVEHLSDEAVATGLRQPITENGGTIPSPVLADAVRYINGFPYKLQMLGHAMWLLASGDGHRISREHLAAAKTEVDAQLEEHIYRLIWKLISPRARELAKVLLDCGGDATVPELQRRLRISREDLEERRDELAAHRLAEHNEGEWAALTETIPAPVLSSYFAPPREQTAATGSAMSPYLELPEPLAAVPAPGRCGLWMPRSRAWCVLPAGHKHRCRSKM